MNDWSAHPELWRPVAWLSTGDPGCPYFEVIDGVNWEIRIKEAGEHESVIYTLTIGGREILEFDEYPPFWKRPPAFD